MTSGEFRQSLAMAAKPDAVFAFVSDVRNLPKYLPTVREASDAGDERVRVQGEAHHHPYDADGYLRADPQSRRMEWGADETYYSGWMSVSPHDSGSEVTIQLTFRGTPAGSPEGGPSKQEIDEGLRRGLASIRNHVEGRGGKEEPAAAT